MEAVKQKAIKGYELKEKIGTGGFGAVYRAQQTTVGREVAIKVILPALASQADFIRRFEGEAQLVAKLEHPHITPLYDYWRDPEGAYLVMRWLRGGSLRDALEKGKFELRSAALLLDQIAGALSLAHRNGIIHRDIKPANILLDEDGNAYLTDFGIAKDLSIKSNGTQPDMIVGSLDYISPEQARSETVSSRTDIYSLGVTLYEMIAGEHPFGNLSAIERLYKHINDPLPEITGFENAAEINRVIQKATAKNPEQRYPDALAFAADFREAIGLNRTSTSVVEILTQREQEILQLIIEGLSNKEIAQKLTVTHGTVKWYVNQIYEKLGVRSRVQAMVRARELNLVVKGNENLDALQVATEDFKADNPYKGLRAFQSADYQDFFGREKLTAKLLKRIVEKGDYSRFLAIVGPSGSGKSSLAKAGLIPALWRGELPNSEKWFIVEMTPSSRPIDELEIALTKLAANQAGNLHEHLQRDSHGLLRAANLILPNDGSELVLVIDQFEEVFTLSEDEAARKHFLDLLYTAVNDVKSRVRLIITLRADFYDRPLHYTNFGEMLRSRLETILPLSAEELERAISKPAERVGVVFEAGLVASMVADMNYQAGALPLLQYALTELFERRKGRLLSREAYEAMGKSTGALAKRADETYEGFDEAGKIAAKQLFLRLVMVTDGAEDTRRRANRSELLALGDTEIMEDVIDAFASYRLLTLDNEPLSREPVVEVAHEAILREWERLRDWLRDSREDLRIQRQVAGMAKEWADAKQDKSFLARGSRLESFEEWTDTTDLLMTGLERTFIIKSIEARSLEAEKEAQQIARENILKLRSQRFLQALVAVFALATLLSGSLAIFAFVQEAESDANLVIANAQRLAAEANSVLADGSGELATLLAISSLNTVYTPQGDVALQRALRGNYAQQIFVGNTDRIWTGAYSPDGRYVLTGAMDNTARLWDVETGQELRSFANVSPALAFSPDSRYFIGAGTDRRAYLWDIQTGAEIRSFGETDFPVSAVAFSPDGRLVAGGTHTGNLYLWDVETAELVHELAGLNNYVTSIQFSPDGTLLATGADSNPTIIWDVATGTEIRRLDYQFPVRSLAFSPDGQYLVTGSSDRTLRLWNVATGSEIRRFIGHGDYVFSVAFSPDGQYVASGSVDLTARLWDVNTGQQIRFYAGHTGTVYTVAFSPDGNYLFTTSKDLTARLWDLRLQAEPQLFVSGLSTFLASDFLSETQAIVAGSDGNAYVWDIATGQLNVSLNGDGAQINVLVASPDGGRIVTGNGNGIIRVWGTSGTELMTLTGHAASIAGLAFSPDGNMLLSGSADKTARLWDLQTGQEIRQFIHSSAVMDVAYSPDGQWILSGNDDGIAYLWDVETGEQIRQFSGSPAAVDAVLFSPDNQFVITAGMDRTARLWNANTGELIRSFEGHRDWIRGLAISHDGRFILTASYDKTARLWDLATGEQLRQFAFHNGALSTVDFSADDQFILTASADGTAKISNIDYLADIETACALMLRDFTADERLNFNIAGDNATCGE